MVGSPSEKSGRVPLPATDIWWPNGTPDLRPPQSDTWWWPSKPFKQVVLILLECFIVIHFCSRLFACDQQLTQMISARKGENVDWFYYLNHLYCSCSKSCLVLSITLLQKWLKMQFPWYTITHSRASNYPLSPCFQLKLAKKLLSISCSNSMEIVISHLN